jgi:hypothetical protein
LPERRTPIPSVSLIYSGEFRIASQLPVGRRITARIHAVGVETLGQGPEQSQKLALELVSADGRPWPRRVILNKTNASILANAFGDEAGNWSGNAIEIWQAQVEFRGHVVAGVKVAPVHQPQRSQSQPPATRGTGNGAGIPEQSLADALEDEVPF